MAITDELRLFAADPYTGWVPTDKQQADLRAIADRIDAEHESACAEAYGNGVMSVPIALDERAWVKLPVDADGVPIRVGDVMYDCNESQSEKFSVAIMELNKWGWSLLDSYGERNEPGQCHHYHAPTVEDVLREFAEKMNENMGMYTGEAIDADEWRDADRQTIAEFAAKLRLAEGVDE